MQTRRTVAQAITTTTLSATRKRTRKSVDEEKEEEEEEEEILVAKVKSDVISTPPPKAKSKNLSPRKTKSPNKVTRERKPPQGWEDIYSLVEELREDRSAPVDDSGSEALPDTSASPQEYRFQLLMCLMLSSQTKDAVVGETIRGMQRDKVLTVDKISAMSSEELNGYIKKVGFHNNKTKYIKQTVEILKEKYQGDIPPTADEMIKDLPGVGPKMAYIVESIAWNRQSGLGVDTHMHRLFNVLKWVNTNTPEQTRLELESWLPREKWPEVNLLWVGFGQEVQQFKPKLLRKALDCSRPAEALRLVKRCGLDYMKEGMKLGLEEDIKRVLKNGQIKQEEQ